MHAWVAYTQQFTFTVIYKSGAVNSVANALGRKIPLLVTLCTKVIMKDHFFTDTYFGPIMNDLEIGY